MHLLLTTPACTYTCTMYMYTCIYIHVADLLCCIVYTCSSCIVMLSACMTTMLVDSGNLSENIRSYLALSK